MAELIDENVSNATTSRPSPRSAGSEQRWFKKRDPVAGTAGTTLDETYLNDVLGMLRNALAYASIAHTLGSGGDDDLLNAMLYIAGQNTQRGTLVGEFRRIDADSAGIRPRVGGQWSIDIDGVVRSSSSELVFDHSAHFEGTENTSQAIYYYVEDVGGTLTPHASHTSPFRPGEAKPGYHRTNTGWRCVGAFWNNENGDLPPCIVDGQVVRFIGAVSSDHIYRHNDASPGPLDLPEGLTNGAWRTLTLNVPLGSKSVNMEFLFHGEERTAFIAASDATTTPPTSTEDPAGEIWTWDNDTQMAETLFTIGVRDNGSTDTSAMLYDDIPVADPSNPQFKVAMARNAAGGQILNQFKARLRSYHCPYLPN